MKRNGLPAERSGQQDDHRGVGDGVSVGLCDRRQNKSGWMRGPKIELRG